MPHSASEGGESVWRNLRPEVCASESKEEARLRCFGDEEYPSQLGRRLRVLESADVRSSLPDHSVEKSLAVCQREDLDLRGLRHVSGEAAWRGPLREHGQESPERHQSFLRIEDAATSKSKRTSDTGDLVAV